MGSGSRRRIRFALGAALVASLLVAQVPALALPTLIPATARAADGPDLIVTSLIAPPVVEPGGSATYTWTVMNQGNQTANAVLPPSPPPFVWGDQLWISSSPTSISGAAPAGGIVAQRSLGPGESYTRTFTATVPSLAPGDYFLILQTDSGSQLTETDETNNLRAIPIAVANPLVVNTPADGNDGTCDATNCTLREAINAANTQAGTDLIRFSDLMTVQPTSALPAITGPVWITGTPPGGGAVVIDGKVAGAGVNGLDIRAASTVSGLVMRDFSISGMFVSAAGTTIRNNQMRNNSGAGLAFAADNLTVTGNTMSGNSGSGLLGSGSNSTFANNLVDGNRGSGFFMGFPNSTTRFNTFIDNTVSNNAGDGYVFRGPVGQTNEITDTNGITRGSITNNGGRGIDLAFGANGALPAPTITGITFGATLTVRGRGGSAALISVYSDPGDEGQTFLGTTLSSELGDWTISSWAYPDMTAIMNALRAGTLKLHATQTMGLGTSEFSLASAVSGVARCSNGDGFTLLPGATVQLLSGTVLVATTIANATTAEYTFTGVAPNARYTVTYAGTVFGRSFFCNVDVTTDATGGGTAGPPAPLVNHGNHTWLNAYALTGSPASVRDVIDRPFRRTFYKVTVAPQQILTVTLRDLTRNYQLLGFRDIRKVADRLLDLKTAGTLDAARLLVGSGTVSAGDLDSGDLDSGDLDSGDLDSGDLDSGDLDSGDLDSGDLDSGDLDSGDLDSGDLDSGDLDSGDVTKYSDVYESAQRAALRYASGHAGTTSETLTIHTRDYSGDLYFAVVGHDGVFDTGGLFEIVATSAPESLACVGSPLTPTAPSAVAFPSGFKVLILTNTAATGLNLAEPAKTAYLSKLSQLASFTDASGFAVNAYVYDLALNANAQAMLSASQAHAGCVPQMNLATDTIKSLIWGGGSFMAANPNAQYVVFAGGDHAIPFRRTADLTFAGEVNYDPPVGGTSGAALANNFYLTDKFYAASSSVDRVGQQVWIAQLSTGRLVESAADITKTIDVYIARNGVATPGTALVAGYAFNTDLVDELQTGLSASGVNTTRLPDNVWSALDIRNALLVPGAPHFDVIAPQAHFTATRMIPADPTSQRVLSTEFSSVADSRFEGTIWLTIGCHSGYNIVDSDASVLTIPTAYPEAILGRGGFLYGGTGYQYGDDVILGDTELLLTKALNEWRYTSDTSFVAWPSGEVPLGLALRNAANSYLNELRSVRDIDRKVADVATMYGLPFYRVKLASGRLVRPAPAVQAATPITGTLSFSDVVASFGSFNAHSVAGGTFFDAGTSLNVSAPAGRPILPARVVDVTRTHSGAPTLPHGAILLGATYATTANTPVLALPRTEDSLARPITFVNSQFSPWLFDLNVLGGDNLVFTPAQYRANPSGLSGLLRLYSSVSARVYYSTRTDIAGGSPLVRGVSLTDAGGRVHVDVTLFTRAPSAQAAYFTYTGTQAPLDTKWKSVELTSDPATPVTGTIGLQTFTVGYLQRWHTVAAAGPNQDIDPTDGDANSLATVNDIRGVIQAVSQSADVVLDTNQMALYSIPPQPATASQPKLTTALAITSAPATARFDETITVTARLTTIDGGLDGKRVIFRLGRESIDSFTATVAGMGGVASAVIPVSVLPGTRTIRASFAEDDDALGSAAEQSLAVGVAATSFAPAGPATLGVQYSDTVKVATLRTPSGPLSWQSVRVDVNVGGTIKSVATFSNGLGDVRLDTTDFDGLAANATGYPVTATFTGDPARFGPATGTYTVIVSPEDATIAVTPVPPTGTGTITIGGTLTQAGPPADRNLGDVTRAKIHWVAVDDVSGTVSGDVNVNADGTWSLTRAYTPSVYKLTFTATGDFTAPAVDTILVVYDPTTFATGGGYVLTTSSSIPNVGAGKKANLGFNVKYKDGTSIPTGGLLAQLNEGSIHLKSKSFDWMVITSDGAGKRAEMQGVATINGEGSYTFTAVAQDLPSGDMFSIEVKDASGTVVLSLSGAMQGGSITVH